MNYAENYAINLRSIFVNYAVSTVYEKGPYEENICLGIYFS